MDVEALVQERLHVAWQHHLQFAVPAQPVWLPPCPVRSTAIGEVWGSFICHCTEPKDLHKKQVNQIFFEFIKGEYRDCQHAKSTDDKIGIPDSWVIYM